MLTNPYVVAIVIPIILLASGAFMKKLVRASPWKRSDFYLGVEFTLAAMTAALVHIFDLVNQSGTATNVSSVTGGQFVGTTVFIIGALFLLFLILSIHQDWEKRDDRPWLQMCVLVGATNLIGAGLLAAFVLFVKGL